MSDPVEPVENDPKTRRRGAATIVIALAFVAACVVSFLVIAIGFGRQG